MDIKIITDVAHCALTTDSTDLANLFVQMLALVITPEQFSALVGAVNPDWTKDALELAQACVGSPS